MDIAHIYEVYKKQNELIYANDEWGKPDVLKQFRERFEGFADSEIETLKFYLNDNEKKWFVANLLDVLDTFPIDLLAPMLNAAVNEPDPSYNNEFIRPCRRVFDYVDLSKILLDIFNKGDKSKKIGVLKALYWTGTTVTILTISENDIFHEKKGREIFYWDPELCSFDQDYVEDPDYYEKEYPKYQKAYCQQLTTLISAFFETDDVELKYNIRLQLPDQIEDYPAQLKDQAEEYLKEKKKQGIPNNAVELEAAMRGLG